MTISDERFEFTSKAKRNLGIVIIVGIVLLILGIYLNMASASHDGGHATLQTTTTTDLVAFNA